MKRVLLICPNFFEYHKLVLNELVERGFEVTWMDDRPSNNFLTKSLIRLNKNLVKHKIENYSDMIANKMKENKFDICIIILGQSFNAKDIKKWRIVNPNCKFVYYTWDSVKNFKNTIELINECDISYSFDKTDVDTYKNLNFLPLFYSKVVDKDSNVNYDFSYIGTIKLGKYEYIKKIINQLETKYPNSYVYFYIQSPLVLMYYKLRFKEFKRAKFSEFKYKKLNYDETLRIYANSRFVVDCQMKNQKGLTMRTFEVLALKSKLVTSNDDIVKYDFFNENNIYVTQGTFDFNDKFFVNNFIENDDFMKNYSLKSFINCLLSEVE